MCSSQLRCACSMAALSAAFIICQPAEATFIVAQYDVFADSGNWVMQPTYEGQYVGQTFTATSAGTLESIDIPLQSVDANNPGSVPFMVELRTTYDSGINGWQPTDTILSSGTIVPSDPQFDSIFISWKTIDMSPCELAQGEIYAIVCNALPSVDAYNWYSKAGGAGYSGGKALVGDWSSGLLAGQNWDLGFRVNCVPEPAMLALLSVGAAALVRRRRK